ARCLGGKATWLRSQCLGLCERAPAALITVSGKAPKERVLAPAKAEKLQLLLDFATHDRLPRSLRDDNPELSVPQFKMPKSEPKKLRLLSRIGRAQPSSLDDYRNQGGYEGLRNALELGPAGVIREVEASKLLGRGGAAFPTAKKWEALHMHRELQKNGPPRPR